MSDNAVGQFVGDNFEATYQKVGTFRVVDGVKTGGNVASYICLTDGTVVHAIPGPLNAKRYLQELRWAIDLRKSAASEAGGDIAKYREVLRKGHLDRLAAESGLRLPPHALPDIASGPPPVPIVDVLHTKGVRALSNLGQVHALLATYPLPKIQHLYTFVFEDILNEKVSTLPVIVK